MTEVPSIVNAASSFTVSAVVTFVLSAETVTDVTLVNDSESKHTHASALFSIDTPTLYESV